MDLEEAAVMEEDEDAAGALAEEADYNDGKWQQIAIAFAPIVAWCYRINSVFRALKRGVQIAAQQ